MEFLSFVRRVGGSPPPPVLGSDSVPSGAASKSRDNAFSFRASGKGGVTTLQRLAVSYAGPSSAAIPASIYVYDERSQNWILTANGDVTSGSLTKLDLISPVELSSDVAVDVYVLVTDPGGLANGSYTFLVSPDSSAAPSSAAPGGGPAVNVAVTNFPLTQSVSVTSTVLPAGAATEAKQDAEIVAIGGLNTSLASIDAKTPNLGQSLAASSVPSVLPAVQEASLRDVSDRAGRLLGHVAVDSSALPVGAATEATLTAIHSRQADGTQQTQVTASALPTGAATSAKQDAGNASLTSIDGKTPALGQALAAASSPVVLPAAQETSLRDVSDRAGRVLGHTVVDSSALPTGAATEVTASAILTTQTDGSQKTQVTASALPTGAATSAKQDTGNTSLASIDGKTPALGQALAAASVPGVLPLAQETSLRDVSDRTGRALGHVTVDSSALPTGAATAAAQTDGTQKAIVRGGAKGATTAADVTSTSQGADHQGLDTNVGSWLGSTTPTVGQKASAASLPVTLASDQATEPNPLHVMACFESRHLGAFGDLIAQPLRPLLQLDFTYGIFTQTGSTAASGTGATVDTNAGRLRIQNGTSNGGSASFTSVRPIRYRPGQGIDARFTAVFTTGVASSSQIVGVGGSVDGYFFGFSGATFGIFHRNAGVDTFIPQSTWNVDKVDGTGTSGFNLNPTLGNVYRVSYPYMGYGNVFFYVEESTNGKIVLVHVIRYVNSSASIQLSNPTLHFFARALSTGSTTNLTIFVGALGIFLVGEREFTGAQFGTDNGKNAVSTETNILSLRNCTTLNGVTNLGIIRLRSLSFTSDNGNTIAVMRVKSGVTLGGTPAFTPISGSTADNGVTLTSAQSMASVDVAGTTVTGGTTLFNSTTARNTGFEIDLTPYDLYINPAETLTFSMSAGANTNTEVCVNWYEDK